MISSRPSARPRLGFLAVLVLTSALQAQDLVLTSTPQSFVRFRDNITIYAGVTNPGLVTLAGYQFFYSFDADYFELATPPYLHPISSMASFFGWNAPPPAGLGWPACAGASDGIGRDYLGALGVELPPYPIAQPSNLLYATDFTAGQSPGPTPIDFIIDEFASCAPSSLLSDSTATALPVGFTNAQVEIIPNIALTGTLAVGQTFNVESRGLPGNPLIILLGTGTTSVTLINKGTLFIELFDPTKPWIILFTTVLPASAGVSTFSLPLTVPSNPIYAGLEVHFQALTGAGATHRFTNLASGTIQ